MILVASMHLIINWCEEPKRRQKFEECEVLMLIA